MPRGIPNAKPAQAKNNPVHAPARELHTADLAVGQQPAIVLPDDGPIEREQVIVALDKQPADDYLQALKFAEEPITIRIERSSEKFAPHSVDCWVNGVGAEVLMRGKWIQCGYLPIGHVVTTKRKYVEVLARSKHDTVQTNVQKHEESEDNVVDRHTSMKTPFSVIRDDNPRGAQWLTRLLAEG